MLFQVKLRGRNPDCTVCGDASRIKVEDICRFNYEEFTGSLSCDKVSMAGNVFAKLPIYPFVYIVFLNAPRYLLSPKCLR
jgi:hypothetical protein